MGISSHRRLETIVAQAIEAQKSIPGGVPKLDKQTGRLPESAMPRLTPEWLGAEPVGTAATLMSDHLRALDPHPQYVDAVEARAIRIACTPPPNTPINGENLQTVIDQMATLLVAQQAQITLLTSLQRQPNIWDTFNDTDNTALSIHTPSAYQGVKWVEQIGKWSTVGGYARANGASGSLAWIESKMAEQIAVEVDIVFADVAVPQTIIFRYDASTGYHWRAGYANKKYVIYEIMNTSTIRVNANVSPTFGQIYKLKVILEGDNIAFYVDGQLILSWASSANKNQTKHGLYCSTSINTKFDNFKVNSL